MTKNIFLTGDLRVGKSTIIDRVIHSLRVDVGGFRTSRYYEQGLLVGFRMEDLKDNNTVKRRSFIGLCREKGCVAVPEVFETIGVRSLQKCLGPEPPGLIIMDELGFLENGASRFQNMVVRCLGSKTPVLGVLKNAHTAFLDSIRERKDLVLLAVTPDNREGLPITVRSLLKEILA